MVSEPRSQIAIVGENADGDRAPSRVEEQVTPPEHRPLYLVDFVLPGVLPNLNRPPSSVGSRRSDASLGVAVSDS